LLTVAMAPASQLSANVVTSTAVIMGRTTHEPIRAGERLSLDKLALPTASTGLSALLPPGHVAVILPVTELISVGGAVQPHDRVDLIATLAVPQANGSQRVVTQALLRNVAVVATGTQTSPQALVLGQNVRQPYSTLTLALTPQDALVVQHLLQANVRMALALRRPDDAQVAEVTPVTMDEIARRYGLQPGP
jgi:pilus assembly protein CpaB